MGRRAQGGRLAGDGLARSGWIVAGRSRQDDGAGAQGGARARVSPQSPRTGVADRPDQDDRCRRARYLQSVLPVPAQGRAVGRRQRRLRRDTLNTAGQRESERRILRWGIEGRVDGVIGVFFTLHANEFRPLIDAGGASFGSSRPSRSRASCRSTICSSTTAPPPPRRPAFSSSAGIGRSPCSPAGRSSSGARGRLSAGAGGARIRGRQSPAPNSTRLAAESRPRACSPGAIGRAPSSLPTI